MFQHAMREEYLKPTPLKPYMTYADHFVWPIHVPRRCEPLITPHLSLWGNSRTRATFPTHKKSHNPHPQGERGKGVNMGTLHCRGVGGCLPNLDHIYREKAHLVGFGKKNSKPCVLNAGNPGCQSHQPFVKLSSRLERHSHVWRWLHF